ncbi:MAG: tetratricopeptide repeat protein [Phycisphaeraceae bacterium]|nr:tetratricopeptide repeat protein [Phycisphaeraceae bacterium]
MHRSGGFIRVAAFFAVLVIGAIIGAAIYLLRDPSAPLDFGSIPTLRSLAPEKPTAPAIKAQDPDARKVDAILDSVDNLLRAQKTSEAQAILSGAIAQFPTDQRLRIAFAELMLDKDDFSSAYDSYVRALAIGPRDARLEFQAGTISSMLGKTDRALEHYAAAQTADPTNAEYPLYLGQVQLQLGRLDEARASLVRAGRLNADDGRVWGSLAEIALRENKLDVAMQQIEKARKLQPRITVWRFIEARIHARAGRPEKTVELLVGLEPSERAVEAHARVLADALSSLHRGTEAAQVLAEASDAAPKNANLAFDAAVRARRAGEASLFERLRDRAKELGHPDAASLD